MCPSVQTPIGITYDWNGLLFCAPVWLPRGNTLSQRHPAMRTGLETHDLDAQHHKADVMFGDGYLSKAFINELKIQKKNLSICANDMKHVISSRFRVAVGI